MTQVPVGTPQGADYLFKSFVTRAVNLTDQIPYTALQTVATNGALRFGRVPNDELWFFDRITVTTRNVTSTFPPAFYVIERDFQRGFVVPNFPTFDLRRFVGVGPGYTALSSTAGEAMISTYDTPHPIRGGPGEELVVFQRRYEGADGNTPMITTRAETTVYKSLEATA